MTTDVREFVKFCNWSLSHCFAEGKTCPHWSHDYVSDLCHGVVLRSAEQCTRFPVKRLASRRAGG